MSPRRRFVAMFSSIVVSATLLAVAFRLLSGPFDEVLAARVGATIAVVGGPAIAAHLTSAGGTAVARAIGLEVVVGAMVFAVSSLLDVVGRYVANVGALAEDSRVERP